MNRLQITQGDITHCTTDAIVNAANTTLLGVIHTPGPIWRGGDHGEADQLADCYRNSLTVASTLGCKTVAFPSISTGVYHFPLTQAARIAVKTILTYLRTHNDIEQVTMVCFDKGTLAAYEQALAETEQTDA